MVTLVMGIGNTLLSDEGIGIHVLNHLQQHNLLPPTIQYLDGGTLSFTLANPIEQCDQLVVIDASELKSPAGTIKTFEDDAMDTFITSGNKKSVHEVGLADVMSIAMLSGNLPAKRALVGIQPAKLDWGEHPTESVKNCIPKACESIQQLISKWTV